MKFLDPSLGKSKTFWQVQVTQSTRRTKKTETTLENLIRTNRMTYNSSKKHG